MVATRALPKRSLLIAVIYAKKIRPSVHMCLAFMFPHFLESPHAGRAPDIVFASYSNANSESRACLMWHGGPVDSNTWRVMDVINQSLSVHRRWSVSCDRTAHRSRGRRTTYCPRVRLQAVDRWMRFCAARARPVQGLVLPFTVLATRGASPPRTGGAVFCTAHRSRYWRIGCCLRAPLVSSGRADLAFVLCAARRS